MQEVLLELGEVDYLEPLWEIFSLKSVNKKNASNRTATKIGNIVEQSERSIILKRGNRILKASIKDYLDKYNLGHQKIAALPIYILRQHYKGKTPEDKRMDFSEFKSLLQFRDDEPQPDCG